MTGWLDDPLGIVQATRFTHTDKWYMYKPDYLLEDDKHKFLWDFKIKTDHSVVQLRSLSD